MLDRIAVALCCLGLVVLVGCGKGGDVARYDVSGTVTYDGNPLPAGTILFQPAPGNTGPGGTARIESGKYNTATGGKSPTGGPHIAVITGFDGKTDLAKEMPDGAILFSDYREDVDLPKEATTKDFNVPAKGKP